MDVRIQPSVLRGDVDIPASKSYAHRAIICAALADGSSVISGVTMSNDIYATIDAMKALGAQITALSDTTLRIDGIKKAPEAAEIDCNESGSTLRFVIPIAAALGIRSVFNGRGRLPQRPIDIYIRELGKHGITFNYNNTMPFDISGSLTGREYHAEGNVSSQFITGLLFALPLLNEDSDIILTSKLESKPYIDITAECMRRFGINVEETDKGYHIKGSQKYKPADIMIEGDYSQAAFFYTANALGSEIKINNLNPESVQGDKKILEIISGMCYNNERYNLKSFNADCSDIPDLVPILTVLGCFGSEKSVIFNAGRLRIKESDRLQAISVTLNTLGGNVQVTDDGLIINPVRKFHGGVVESFGDHRIVMSAAIAALKADGEIIIRGAEAVEKSYPGFFRDYNKLGGKAYVITLE